MDGYDLTPIQVRGLAVLLAARTLEDAADQLGVHINTIYNWLREPDFRQALAELQAGILDQAAHRMVSLTTQAMDALAEVLANPKAPASVRLKAVELVVSPAIFRLNRRADPGPGGGYYWDAPYRGTVDLPDRPTWSFSRPLRVSETQTPSDPEPTAPEPTDDDLAQAREILGDVGEETIKEYAQLLARKRELGDDERR